MKLTDEEKKTLCDAEQILKRAGVDTIRIERLTYVYFQLALPQGGSYASRAEGADLAVAVAAVRYEEL